MYSHQLLAISCQLINPLLIVFLFSLAAYSQSKNADDEKLLEIGAPVMVKAHSKLPSEIKIVSYNIRYRGDNDLQKLIELFKSDKEIGGAQILGLQEVDRNRKRTRNENTAKTLAQSLEMNYAWAAPPNAKGKEREEEESGVAIFSAFPLSDVTRIVLPVEGPGGRRRVALGATVRIGTESIRFYSVHAETRTTPEKKVEQLTAVIDDLNNYPQIKRAVILGDFNTILPPKEGKDVAALFQSKGFTTPFPNDWSTWKWRLLLVTIDLRLDWIWLRGLEVSDFGIDRQITLSDHFPLWVKASFVQTQTATPKTRNENLRQELLRLERTDQEIRRKNIEKKYQDRKLIEKELQIDDKSTRRLKEIVALFGWPSADLVGKDGANAALILLQHSHDHAFQEKMLPFIEEAAKRGDVFMENYVLLVDRVRVHNGKPQLYGTQASMKDGKLIVDPIEDEERVDERRKALGLRPLSEYLKVLAEIYKLPVERPKATSP